MAPHHTVEYLYQLLLVAGFKPDQALRLARELGK